MPLSRKCLLNLPPKGWNPRRESLEARDSDLEAEGSRFVRGMSSFFLGKPVPRGRSRNPDRRHMQDQLRNANDVVTNRVEPTSALLMPVLLGAILSIHSFVLLPALRM